MLTWRIGCAPNNASKWQMGFNLAFKGFSDGKVAMNIIDHIFMVMYVAIMFSYHGTYSEGF